MLIVGIAGGSGSGKTTFAKKILNHETLKGRFSSHVALLHQDSYYLAFPPDRLKTNGKNNFDHPDAFDWDLMLTHLQALRSGGQVPVPVYDYSVSRRTDQVEMVGPCRALLVEGIFTLWDARMRGLFDIRVFLEVDADIRFIRRLHRDVRERGRSVDGIIRQYYDTVRPMHREFMEPTRQYADVIVGEETDIAADVLAARISKYMETME
jgi:uridine kinase